MIINTDVIKNKKGNYTVFPFLSYCSNLHIIASLPWRHMLLRDETEMYQYDLRIYISICSLSYVFFTFTIEEENSKIEKGERNKSFFVRFVRIG